MSSGCALTEVFVSPFRDGGRAAAPSCSSSSSGRGLSVSAAHRPGAASQRLPYTDEALKSCAAGRARAPRRASWGSPKHHGLQVSRVSVRNQRSRWGSCSPSGHICLNWRLVLMPDDVRDYVLIHELMHLRRLDHSRHFWRLVAACVPRLPSDRGAGCANTISARLGADSHWKIGRMADFESKAIDDEGF